MLTLLGVRVCHCPETSFEGNRIYSLDDCWQSWNGAVLSQLSSEMTDIIIIFNDTTTCASLERWCLNLTVQLLNAPASSVNLIDRTVRGRLEIPRNWWFFMWYLLVISIDLGHLVCHASESVACRLNTQFFWERTKVRWKSNRSKDVAAAAVLGKLIFCCYSQLLCICWKRHLAYWWYRLFLHCSFQFSLAAGFAALFKCLAL
jgi:hypothetical protein